jgi:putative oxidoreductase
MSMKVSNQWYGYAQSALRVVGGLLFTAHGLQKAFGMFGGLGGHGATAPTGSLMWVAGVIELVLGSLFMLGLLTRPVAFVLCGEMAVAYFHAHFPRGFWPIQNGGELAVLYCFLFLFFCAAGAGPVSVDRALKRD